MTRVVFWVMWIIVFRTFCYSSSLLAALQTEEVPREKQSSSSSSIYCRQAHRGLTSFQSFFSRSASPVVVEFLRSNLTGPDASAPLTQYTRPETWPDNRKGLILVSILLDGPCHVLHIVHSPQPRFIISILYAF